LDVLGITITHIQVFLLVLARTASLFFAAPVFSSLAIPPQVKVWLAALISLVFVPGVMNGLGGDVAALNAMLQQPLVFVFMLVTQCVIGFLMGFAANLLFVGMQMAGDLIDLQIGFATINLLNPFANQPVSLLASFQHFTAMILFLAFNGHHWLLLGVGQSFQLVPLTGGVTTAAALSHIMALFAGMMGIAVKVAAPAVGALLLADAVLGLIARTIPQMNVFVVGFPLKIGVGLGVLLISLPYLEVVLQSLFGGLPKDLLRLMGS
jgi:flagellar biosynthetic protein FliR